MALKLVWLLDVEMIALEMERQVRILACSVVSRRVWTLAWLKLDVEELSHP